jgi:CrcB protein
MLAWGSWFAVGGGAAVGAWLRWGLGAALNPLFPTLPLGTLAAEMRLLVTTGFLGGLTTFSTFSAEITTLLLRREWLWSLIGIGAHLAGSLLLTVVGILLARALMFWGGSP